MGFLQYYNILCPNLQSLQINWHRSNCSHIRAAVSCAISRTQSLKALSAGDFLAEAHRPVDLKRFIYGTPPFENLRTLILYFPDLSSIIPYLGSHSQPSEYISFRLDIAPTHEVLVEFFTALGSTTRQRTLRRIRLSMEASKEQPMPLQAIDFQVLSLLMRFNLHALDVDLRNPIILIDDELAHLVQAWPDLEMFYLNEFGLGDQSTSNIPTLKGLLLVIERCPKLRGLGLCVDAADVPS